YSDAGVTDGAATGFAYDYQQLDLFSFTLNSTTTYTFTDQKTGAHFDGTLSGTISQVEFLRDNESASNPSNGQDFKFNTLQITTSVPEPTALALGGLGCGLLLWGRRQKVTR
ncbi:MAG TPA: PEP-CTERM sorting domain-containing protein, partial [Dongiaceae bacterium]|nr:PEP-CTERM sorting domain-containing protein [Dongiaceae bacterium]